MKRDVQINIKGIQKNEEAQEILESAAFGEFGLIGSTYCLRYEEISEDGDTIRTLIKISGERIEVIKKSAVESKMMFVVGETTYTQYNTPYGMLEMALETTKADFEVSEDCLSIDLEYLLYLCGEFVSVNSLSIRAM